MTPMQARCRRSCLYNQVVVMLITITLHHIMFKIVVPSRYIMLLKSHVHIIGGASSHNHVARSVGAVGRQLGGCGAPAAAGQRHGCPCCRPRGRAGCGAQPVGSPSGIVVTSVCSCSQVTSLLYVVRSFSLRKPCGRCCFFVHVSTFAQHPSLPPYSVAC